MLFKYVRADFIDLVRVHEPGCLGVVPDDAALVRGIERSSVQRLEGCEGLGRCHPAKLAYVPSMHTINASVSTMDLRFRPWRFDPLLLPLGLL